MMQKGKKNSIGKVMLTSVTMLTSILTLHAQKDKDKQPAVNVYSTFTPTLGNTQMPNFGNKNASLPSLPKADFDYQVVDQNLFFPQSPGSLHPITLSIPEGTDWKRNNFFKLGYGNYKTPYAEGNFAMGDGENSSFTLRGLHTSSQGKLPQQKFYKTEASLDGVINVGDNNELSGKVFYNNNLINAYGIPTAYYPLFKNFADGYNGPIDFDSSKLKYNDYGVKLQFKNKTSTVYDLDYSPSIYFERFSDNWSAREYNTIIDVPVTKKVQDDIYANIGVSADITSYKNRDTSISNNIFYLKPSLAYKTADDYLKIGAIPLVEKGKGKLLPDIEGEKKIADELIITAGYTGYYDKNTFKNQVSYNPWVYQPNNLNNTRVVEIYGGIRGAIGDHISYTATYSQLTYQNALLYLNDSIIGNRFMVNYEPKMKDKRISGGLGYEVTEVFSIAGNLTYHDYKLDSNAKAWGLLPLEVNGNLRWSITDDLILKSDVNYWTGTWALDAANNPIRMKSVVNLNAGLEFEITQGFSLWVKANNILNNKYQRWNQYENLGLNVYGGLIFNF